MNEKRYFNFFVLVVGVLLGLAAIVSYVEDPGGVFSQNVYENGVADILLSGHTVAHIENYDDRLLQIDLISKDQRQIDVIVLGSSRSMQIHNSPLFGDKFRGNIFFNHAVTSSTLKDYIAILELYFKKDSYPKTIIIGVDPWVLNANHDLKIPTTLENEYRDGIARINQTFVVSEMDASEHDSYDFNNDIDRYTSLISQPIIIKSIGKLLYGSYYATDLDEADVAIKNKDGSLMYPADIRKRTVQQIDNDANNKANTIPLTGLGNFSEIDNDLQNQFESAIHYLKNKNTTIILYLPPCHPIVYKKISTDPQYSIVKEVELYFKEFALTENITIIGSYDPNQMNLTSADFYDGSHLRREAIDELFAAKIAKTMELSENQL